MQHISPERKDFSHPHTTPEIVASELITSLVKIVVKIVGMKIINYVLCEQGGKVTKINIVRNQISRSFHVISLQV